MICGMEGMRIGIIGLTPKKLETEPILVGSKPKRHLPKAAERAKRTKTIYVFPDFFFPPMWFYVVYLFVLYNCSLFGALKWGNMMFFFLFLSSPC